MKDSGEKRMFPSGSVRDRDDSKPRPDLISPFALLEVGQHMRQGDERYGQNNWMLGQPFSEVTASMYRHLLAWMTGDERENHLAAIIFGAQALMHYREMIRRDLLPKELDDLPKYQHEVHFTEGEPNESEDHVRDPNSTNPEEMD